MRYKIVIWVFIVIALTSLFLTFCSKQDIEQATMQELQEIDGIGTILSERIVSYIQVNRVTDVNDLIEVEGIGKHKLKQIKKVFE